MKLYLDASVLVAILTDEPLSQTAFDTIRANDHFPMVSDFCRAECSATFAKLARTGKRSSGNVDHLHRVLDLWALTVGEPVLITSRDVEEAALSTRRHDLALRAPDAIHIAATRRLGATLLTLDRGMARAAADLGVPHLNPAEPQAPANRKTE